MSGLGQLETSATPRQVPIRHGSSATMPLTSEHHQEPASPTENSRLETASINQSYGTLPTRRRVFNKSAIRKQLPLLHSLSRARSHSFTQSAPFTPASFRDFSFSRLSSRPKSTYDDPIQSKAGETPDADAQVNGIRVWYSSYTSIDWLHDAIKDSARFSRLRKRKSIRSRLRLVFDKSLGWIIVTIVGFLSAIVAFLVVRSEQWLFDLKEGHCIHGWWKAKRFCCPQLDDDLSVHAIHGAQLCPAWKTWSDILSPSDSDPEANAIEYVSYTFIAVSLISRQHYVNYQLIIEISSCSH